MRTTIIAIGAALLALGLALPAQASQTTSGGFRVDAEQLASAEYMKKGGWNRGRHLGWRIGRGNPHRIGFHRRRWR